MGIGWGVSVWLMKSGCAWMRTNGIFVNWKTGSIQGSSCIECDCALLIEGEVFVTAPAKSLGHYPEA